MATASWSGYDRVNVMLGRLAHPDPSPLLEEFERVIVEGNRRGVLAGLDGNNRPMPPLKYRGGAGKPTKNRARNRGYAKLPPANPGGGANLTTAEYRRLTGPRLAPRYDRSRVIANLATGHGQQDDRTWFAVGSWDDVVSKDGKKFLPYHFNGTSRLPKYDLRPVRPEDREKARRQAVAFVKALIRGQR